MKWILKVSESITECQARDVTAVCGYNGTAADFQQIGKFVD